MDVDVTIFAYAQNPCIHTKEHSCRYIKGKLTFDCELHGTVGFIKNCNNCKDREDAVKEDNMPV